MMKRTKVLLAVSAVTVLVGAAGGAVADKAGKYNRGEAIFTKLDADKDGKVTRAEAEAYRDQQIVQFDADKDGELNQAEYTAMVNAMMADRLQKRFERKDTDNSGTLNKDELSARIDRMFEHLDQNKDGAVEKTELKGMKRHGHRDGGKG